MDFCERFKAELDKVTIKADMPAAAVVGECLRAARRAQNAWDDEWVEIVNAWIKEEPAVTVNIEPVDVNAIRAEGYAAGPTRRARRAVPLMARVMRRLYWRCRAWWARVECRLRGYPARPPLDDIMRRIIAEHQAVDAPPDYSSIVCCGACSRAEGRPMPWPCIVWDRATSVVEAR